jgi:hypothetical protein
MLLLLAKLKSIESYALLKQLLTGRLPKQGAVIALQAPLLDSLSLTATLFPALLQKADDSLLAPVIAAVTTQLLDSSFLKREDILPYQKTILDGAKSELFLLRKGEYEPWELIRWAKLLSWLNVPEGTVLLNDLLRQKDVYLKQAAILALLKNSLPVPATEISRVAADRSARLHFYKSLQEVGKTSLFPPLYATQKSLAESDVYNLLTEDFENNFTLSYLGERTANYDGRPGFFTCSKCGWLPKTEQKKIIWLLLALSHRVQKRK